MPLACSAAALVASIGSSTHHTADIVLGIEVGAALIVFLVVYVMSRRRSRRRR